jgi:alkylation response protein AidB-like acyl-CoA dehydrogenase
MTIGATTPADTAGAGDRLLATVRESAPAIARRSPEIEEARRLPPDLVEQLASIGFFRMLLPRRWGGLEIDFPKSVEILAELSAADGSVGWTSMIGCETPQLFALLPAATFEAIYASGPDVIVGGAFAPRGVAEAIDDGKRGFRVSGRWSFASGCQHARWLFGNCVVTTGGQPAPGPAPGAPMLRCAVLPASAWTIHDTWRTAGLRGTGSHDIEIRDVAVAEEWTFDLFLGDPFARLPLFGAPLLQFSTHIGAVALGIAEGALRDLIALGQTNKQRLYAKNALADSPLFQYRLGHAEADLDAARALLLARAGELWSQARASGVEPSMRNKVLQTTAWVAETATRVVDACYTAGGGAALYSDSPLQRRLRDIHALTQHASLQESVFATAGAERLGRSGPFGV